LIQGNLGGLTGADSICQQRAQAANLPGTYKAWLSDTTGSPATRFVQSPDPYQLVDGTQVAANYAALTDGALDAAIAKTESGATLSSISFNAIAWTNTRTDGTAQPDPSHCANWSSDRIGLGAAGLAYASDGTWTAAAGGQCNEYFRLYCFQQS
jgi:hypothetical protein